MSFICERTGCKNKPVKTFIPKIGYICDDCIDEFINRNYFKGSSIVNDHSIKEVLEVFMGFSKKEELTEIKIVRIFFNQYRKK